LDSGANYNTMIVGARNTHIPLGEFTSLSGIAYSVIRNQLQGF